MGHANKGSSSQNNHWWNDGDEIISAPFSGTNTIVVPDSYGFVLIQPSSPSVDVTTIDSEWFYGRLIEFTIAPGSVGLIRFKSGGNLITSSGNQALVANGSIRFRAVRSSTGSQVWLQVGLSSITGV